jgi:hypothetical protein
MSSEAWSKDDDVIIGLEMSLMTQEQVVSEFRELVEHNIAAATDRYAEFAEKLEKVASGGNAQIRSLMGGPDSSARAGLIDIMAGRYATASDDVKKKIRAEAMRPLLRDNFFYVQLAVAQMTNPYLVGDIIREKPLANPGADYYEEDLLKTGDAQDPDLLQFWLNKFGYNMFAATTIALQRDHEESVSTVIADNEPLFQDAAHVTAATHDFFAELSCFKGSTMSKPELTAKYRSSFADDFAEMTRLKTEQANWLPLGSMILQLYSS